MGGNVQQSCRAIAAHSAASKAMQSEINMLVCKGPAHVGAKAAAILGRIEGSRSIRARLGCGAADGGCSYVFARKDAVPETAVHTENFVVAEAGLEGQLRDDIRRRIKRIVSIEVVKTAANASRPQ